MKNSNENIWSIDTSYYHPIKKEYIPIKIDVLGMYCGRDFIDSFVCGFEKIEYELQPADKALLSEDQLKMIDEALKKEVKIEVDVYYDNIFEDDSDDYFDEIYREDNSDYGCYYEEDD